MKKEGDRFSMRLFNKYMRTSNNCSKYDNIITKKHNRSRKRHSNMSFRFFSIYENCIYCDRRKIDKRKRMIVYIIFDDHVSVAIVNFRNKHIEYFNSWYDEKYYNDIQNAFNIVPEFTGFEFVCVNNYDLQDDNYNCFAWPWFYLDQRFIQKKSANDIINEMKSINSDDRNEMVNEYFFNK